MVSYLQPVTVNFAGIKSHTCSAEACQLDEIPPRNNCTRTRRRGRNYQILDGATSLAICGLGNLQGFPRRIYRVQMTRSVLSDAECSKACCIDYLLGTVYCQHTVRKYSATSCQLLTRANPTAAMLCGALNKRPWPSNRRMFLGRSSIR